MIKRILYILAIALSILACTDEIDKSNRFTFTGETIADFLLNRSDKYSHFTDILKRSNLLGLLSTYGQYTLFLPDNGAVEKYIDEKDSIYWATKETDTPIWTGITSPLVEELSDSMANVIARNHVVEAMYRNGERARLFSNIITKETPSGISSVEKSLAVQQIGNMLLIDAEAVQVVSSNGETIVGGTDITTLSTDGWSGGIYIVRTLNEGQWTSHKLVIK